MEILQNVIIRDDEDREFPSTESYNTLANIARVSRRFNALVIPLLYREITVYLDEYHLHSALQHLGTPSERFLRHARTLKIGLYSDAVRDYPFDKVNCNELHKFLSKSYRLLLATPFLRTISLRFLISDPMAVDRPLRHKIKINNHVICRIVRHIYSLNLRTLNVIAPPQPENLKAMRILERKVTELTLIHDDINRFSNYTNLSSLRVFYAGPGRISTKFDDEFWTSLSQLRNLKEISCLDIPFSSTLDTRFPYLLSLDLLITRRLTAADWASSVKFIMTQMPNLENLSLCLSKSTDPNFDAEGDPFEDITNTIDIRRFNSHHLKLVSIVGYSPNHMLAAIGTHCLNLSQLRFETSNIDDDDLRALSRCTLLQQLILSYPTKIRDLSCIALLPKLRKLELHYSMGRYITSDFLVELARGCPLLDTISVSNKTTVRDDSYRPFEEKDIAVDFAVGEEMLGYIKLRKSEGRRFSSYRSEEYVIHIDRLRQDRAFV
jgi:hypothetical protein